MVLLGVRHALPHRFKALHFDFLKLLFGLVVEESHLVSIASFKELIAQLLHDHWVVTRLGGEDGGWGDHERK